MPCARKAAAPPRFGEAVLVIGLPGSGKTHLVRGRMDPARDVFVDDPRNEEDLRVAAPPPGGGTLWIADPWLCLPDAPHRAAAALARLHPGVPVTFVYFRNDPASALANASRPDRAGKAVHSLLRGLSACYVVPSGHGEIPVWSARPLAGISSALPSTCPGSPGSWTNTA